MPSSKGDEWLFKLRDQEFEELCTYPGYQWNENILKGYVMKNKEINANSPNAVRATEGITTDLNQRLVNSKEDSYWCQWVLD